MLNAKSHLFSQPMFNLGLLDVSMAYSKTYKVISNIEFEISFIKAVDEVIKKCIRVGEAEMYYNDGHDKSNVVITAKWADYPDRKHKTIKLWIK